MVAAKNELQSASRLALGTPPEANWTARAQLSTMHALLHAADAPPARATAPRRDTTDVGGAMAQCRTNADEMLDNAASWLPLSSRHNHRSYTTLLPQPTRISGSVSLRTPSAFAHLQKLKLMDPRSR
jgi:hypothetical protein